MDLYEILLEGSSKGNIFLRHNDVVFVPPIGDTVGVAGEVNRPAIYEIKQEKTVNQVLVPSALNSIVCKAPFLNDLKTDNADFQRAPDSQLLVIPKSSTVDIKPALTLTIALY